MGALTVVCVNWRNYRGQGEQYVSRLKASVAQHLSIEHEFVCLTEKELGEDLKGWWAKLKLFQPGRFAGDVLYLDLDVVLTANIDGIVEAASTDRTKLWMRDDFSYSLKKTRKDIGPDMIRTLGGLGCANSSVMFWTGDAARRVWDTFNPQTMNVLHGDQNHISRVMWPDHMALLPDELICSYKYHIQRGVKAAPIVVFHGSPKVTDLPKRDHLRMTWEAAA